MKFGHIFFLLLGFGNHSYTQSDSLNQFQIKNKFILHSEFAYQGLCQKENLDLYTEELFQEHRASGDSMDVYYAVVTKNKQISNDTIYIATDFYTSFIDKEFSLYIIIYPNLRFSFLFNQLFEGKETPLKVEECKLKYEKYRDFKKGKKRIIEFKFQYNEEVQINQCMLSLFY